MNLQNSKCIKKALRTCRYPQETSNPYDILHKVAQNTSLWVAGVRDTVNDQIHALQFNKNEQETVALEHA